jgi:hypothetical protein
MNRLLLGALAGIAGTFAMTAAARAMHRRLPAAEQYPLPPREIIEGTLPAAAKRFLEEHGRQTATLAAHFGYGAATGALYALVAPRSGVLPGAAYGVLIWSVSYFGIMPGLRILRPAHEHPLAAVRMPSTPDAGPGPSDLPKNSAGSLHTTEPRLIPAAFLPATTISLFGGTPCEPPRSSWAGPGLAPGRTSCGAR